MVHCLPATCTRMLWMVTIVSTTILIIPTSDHAIYKFNGEFPNSQEGLHIRMKWGPRVPIPTGSIPKILWRRTYRSFSKCAITVLSVQIIAQLLYGTFCIERNNYMIIGKIHLLIIIHIIPLCHHALFCMKVLYSTWMSRYGVEN